MILSSFSFVFQSQATLLLFSLSPPLNISWHCKCIFSGCSRALPPADLHNATLCLDSAPLLATLRVWSQNNRLWIQHLLENQNFWPKKTSRSQCSKRPHREQVTFSQTFLVVPLSNLPKRYRSKIINPDQCCYNWLKAFTRTSARSVGVLSLLADSFGGESPVDTVNSISRHTGEPSHAVTGAGRWQTLPMYCTHLLSRWIWRVQFVQVETVIFVVNARSHWRASVLSISGNPLNILQQLFQLRRIHSMQGAPWGQKWTDCCQVLNFCCCPEPTVQYYDWPCVRR